jgi:penicillin-binding protein 1A
MTAETVPDPFVRRPWWRRATRGGVRVAAIVVIGVPLAAVCAAGIGFYLLLYGELPGTVPEENERVVAIPSQVFDSQGTLIGEFRQFDLTVPVRPEDVPQVVKDAVVSAEDRNFWEHHGLDAEGLTRAALANYEKGEVVQGGSTITQQYVKARFLSTERSIERKLTEAILATRIEREISKEEILFEYLDTTYFGGGAYGIGAASESYFRKPVSELNISESALLASIIPAPSRYEPRANPFEAEARRVRVLEIMRDEGYITGDELETARAETLWFAGLGVPDRPATIYHAAPRADAGSYPYFQDYVREYLTERYGEDTVFRGGLRIETTIDPHLQAQADAAVAAELEGTAPPLEMSLVSVEPATGHVKAMVGGRDWNASQVNLALGGSLGMQPGSSFKTFTLARALEEGYQPGTVYPAPGVWAIPGTNSTIKNYGGGGYGSLTLEAATHSSVNTVFAQLIYDVGVNDVAELARRVGVTGIDPEVDYQTEHGVSFTLGSAEVSPLDMAAGYSVFANSGVRAPATPVIRVTDVEGNVLEDNTQVPRGTRVMYPAVADWVTQNLRGVFTSGPGKRASIGRPAAGKTGTAQHNWAAWFVGYTPQLSTSVWIGYPDELRPLRGINGFSTVTGGSIPARTWAAFMGPAHEALPVIDFRPPGALPAPNGDVTIRPAARRAPVEISRECGGVCAPPPEAPEPDESPDAATVPDDAATDENEGDAPGPPGETNGAGAPP